MKRSITSKLFSILSASLVVVVTSLSANADEPAKKPGSEIKPISAAGVVKALGKVQLDPELVKTHSKAEIAHVPLKLSDLKINGAAVAADTMIKLGNGTSIKASEYLDRVNKAQQHFNKLGYSIHSKDGKGATILLHETKMDPKLDDHAKKIHALHKEFNPQSMRRSLKLADLDKLHTDKVANDMGRLAKLNEFAARPEFSAKPEAAKTVHTIKQWNYLLGSKNLVAAYLAGKVEIKGDQNEVTVSGDARAGGYLKSKEFNLIKATGNVYSPTKGQSKANLDVYLLGQHVINVHKSGDATFKINGTKQHGIDVHANLHFTIGPIPMNAKLGAKGNAGVRYLVAVRPAHATLQVTPFVDARVYAQVGVDLGIASGGVGGEVTLLKNELTFGGELGIDFDSTRGPILSEHVYVKNNMTMLSGKVYAWAKVNYFIGSHTWNHTLFSWKGVRTSGYLINQHATVPLIPNFQATASAAANTTAK